MKIGESSIFGETKLQKIVFDICSKTCPNDWFNGDLSLIELKIPKPVIDMFKKLSNDMDIPASELKTDFFTHMILHTIGDLFNKTYNISNDELEKLVSNMNSDEIEKIKKELTNEEYKELEKLINEIKPKERK
jgi:hypothetical protein